MRNIPVTKNLDFGQWFKYISIFSSGGNFVQQIITVCATLIERIMRNIHAKLF